MSQQDDRVQNEEIVDDTPVMRSVAILSHHSTTTPSLGFPPRLGGVQFGTSPYGGLKTATTEQKSAALSKSPVAATPPSKPWKVVSLRAIPPYYQLERTHVHLPVEVSLVDVTNRVMDILRLESIAAVYNDDEAKVSAETKECVKFVLRLWNSTSNQIVVECQRTAGCGMTYYQVVKKVLKAARDGSKAPAKKVPTSIPSELRKNAPLRLPEDHMNDSVKDSVQLACEMLQSGRLDSQQLSIESLVQLSQAYKSQCFCARLILTNGILLPAILSLVVFSRLDPNGTDAPNGSIEQEVVSVMRRHALTVLANCFSSFDDLTFRAVLADSPSLADEKLLRTLVLTVASASTKPHEAADACKCLHFLCQRSDLAKQRAAALNASMYLENAQQCRHATLQDASVKLIEILN